MMDLTKQELADAAGYTYRQLYNIDRGLPPDKKLFVKGEEGRKCDLAVFVQRWVAYNVDKATAGIDDLDAVKAIHEKVKTRKTELEVARLEGELVSVEDVRRIWGDIANTVMQNMLRIPAVVAPMVTMMENVEVISGLIDGEIRKALEAVAQTPVPEYAVAADTESEEEE